MSQTGSLTIVFLLGVNFYDLNDIDLTYHASIRRWVRIAKHQIAGCKISFFAYSFISSEDGWSVSANNRLQASEIWIILDEPGQ